MSIQWTFMPSDHFDGKHFFTPGAPQPKSFSNVLRWMLTRDRATWHVERDAPTSLPPARVSGNQLFVTFVNHSTVLIQTAGLNILTDPIWSERASPFSFVGPKRFSRPGIGFDNLPPIHIVLLSHNHYDHMDLPTLRAIQKNHAPRVYAPLGNGRYLVPAGMKRAVELDWWQADKYSDQLTVHCTPSQHFSGRSLADRNRALWCSWVLQAPAGNIYFAGDTGFGSHFRDVKTRFESFRLALLPIGAYEPRWFMSPVHMDPDEAVQAHEILAPLMSIGIHHGTFQLTDEAQNEPRERTERLAAEKKLNFRILRNGESLQLA
ncbi:MAG TPA: MBL fold metallo-hydrolase [Terriglobales bacterium]|nr:MBL fold metallo-hydrolase [Terriglobales bacterium]